jgi:hypothetical protein
VTERRERETELGSAVSSYGPTPASPETLPGGGGGGPLGDRSIYFVFNVGQNYAPRGWEVCVIILCYIVLFILYYIMLCYIVLCYTILPVHLLRL